MKVTYEQIREDARKACAELVEIAKLKQGDILVIGCSSSEVVGLRIGKGSDIIVEKEALLPGTEIVNVVPQPHAGGSFAMTVYEHAECPVAVEQIQADAGMDIGDTLIGMQLKHVAVPVRLSVKQIGEAHLVCARTRPKFIGGSRAVYDDALSGGDIPR